MDLLSIFYGHIDTSLIPTSTKNSGVSRGGLTNNPAVDRASVSLIALTKIGNIVAPPHPQISLSPIEKQTLKSWPAVYKWCTFFYTTRIEPGDAIKPELRRAAMDMIGGVIYSLSRFDSVRKVIADTPGAIELATRIWLVEDACIEPSSMPIPVNSAALDALLIFPDYIPPPFGGNPFVDERENAVRSRLDRVVTAAGGDTSRVVDLTFSRIRTATAIDERIHEPRTAIILDLIGHLSRSASHPLRLAFLSKGITAFVTKLAVVIVGMLDRSHVHQQGLLDSLVASLGFLSNTIESTDGFTWVGKAVSAGFLQAWTGAARHIHTFDNHEDAEMVIEIMEKIVPRYMVYKSVINSVHTAMKKVKDETKFDDWKDHGAKKVWATFEELALERYTIGQDMKTLKGAACDNYANCHNIDLKNNFMKCSGCSNTLYCSRECQKVAWKEGGHKLVCKLKQQELLEGKFQSVSKTDATFFHHLATSDARRYLPTLRRLAESTYPLLADSPTSLVTTIDYMVYPPRLGLYPLAEHEKYSPQRALNVSPNAELRNDELIQRARDHPGEYGIIQSKMANGQGMQSVLSIVPGAFLEER
ncbi:hypothetical protein HYPSUDRAFT_150369 [Hypholoma sublateritium FD-334 SS-4]|uniref:MYND-type domain-containing protein n=1 Tax=Hypholoma sublateritium (strain FD-334 SS-4) TaxID=945553 RepID=A0A0D2LUH7_HYPSF|nr:hypothetical protein HYPSUDRAFT_150369 [Hypholoma sublateritium FD-334 SS-4]